MKRLVFAALLALILGFSPSAHAVLINNGNGLIYDTVLNITWYDYVYYGNWVQATAWAASLTVGGTTAGTWTLPTTLPVNGSTYNYNYSWNGSTDYGSNISAPGSAYPGSTSDEMAYLYYVDLGNKAFIDVNGKFPQSGWGLTNKGPFTTLESSEFWSSTQYAPQTGYAWTFDFTVGSQQFGVESGGGNGDALAVHSGDIGVPTPTPIPGALLLFGPGLLGLAVVGRRFKK